jgi:RimJ/RimL family protein N-acetyltransferase
VLRPAVGADARAVCAMIDAIAAEPAVPLLATPGSITLRDVRNLIARSARDPRGLFLVAEVDGVTAANLGGAGLAFGPSSHVFELGMSVAAAYRGQGVGGALLETAAAWAATAGFAKVALSAFPHNTRAIAFYERHGFTFEGRRVRQLQRAGRFYDEVLMGRELGVAGPPPAGAPPLRG